MNILIIDDSPAKIEAIKSVVEVSLPEVQLEIAMSLMEALRFLEETSFDLLILDLVLPSRAGGEARSENGLAVLREIYEGGLVQPPNHIVCLSEYDQALQDLKDEANRRLVHLVKYSDCDTGWSTALIDKLKYVSRNVEAANFYPQSHLIDVGVITSYPTVELQAVLQLDGQVGAEFHKKDELYYYHAQWVRQNSPLKVVACAAPTMGMTASCTAAMKLIARWRPRYLVMTGIAAGTSRDLTFGDIMIADSCYDYGSGKIRDTADGLEFIPSPQQISLDTDIKALLQSWEREQRGMAEIGSKWKKDGSFKPRLSMGIIATGAAVVQSSKYVDDIIEHSRKVVGLEMEAYGVCQAARYATHPKPKVLIAKSVSDFADPAKGDSFQMLAAFTSAQFIYKFFTEEEHLF